MHVYEHATVRLHFFRVVEWSRRAAGAREARRFVWQRLDAPIAEPMLPANAPVLASLALPLEYAITDAQALGAAEQLARVEARMKDGLRLVQVRDKGNWERARLIYVVTSMARQYGARVLVNGGPAADGIHFSAEQLMTLRARPQGGPNCTLMAASCHTVEELGHAMAIGLDFVVLGPVKATRVASRRARARLGRLPAHRRRRVDPGLRDRRPAPRRTWTRRGAPARTAWR